MNTTPKRNTTPETDNRQQAESQPKHDQTTASNPDNAKPSPSATPDASAQTAQPQAQGQARQKGGAQAESVTTQHTAHNQGQHQKTSPASGAASGTPPAKQPAPHDLAQQTPQTTPEKHSTKASKQDKKHTFDPSQPLKNQRYEKMATLRVAENTQEQCYILTAKGKIKKGGAKSRASHVFARPDVSARVDWLRIQAALAPKAPQNAPGGPISTAGKATPAGKPPRKADLALAQRKASEALFLAETPADIVKAVTACRDLGLIDTAEQAKADPTLVLQAILSYSGRTGAEICEQLGGLAFMLDKFLTVCKVSPAELMQTLAQRYPETAPAKE